MPTVTQICHKLVCKDFQLEGKEDSLQMSWEELVKFLSIHVKYLLDNDMNTLLNILYRIDIPEEKVKQILHYSSPENMSNELAEVIIQRQKQKAETRLKYAKP